MPKISYKDWRPTGSSRALIRQAEVICQDYAQQGYGLTLRQLYYRLVAGGVLPNNLKSYKRLGNIMNEARLAGHIDWLHLEDRHRHLKGGGGFDSPAQAVKGVCDYYGIDRWKTQPFRVEVWVEKDALSGVVGRVADEFNLSYFACKGYPSVSELWRASRRLNLYIWGKKQEVLILHLGDHDPSGIDMTRDIEDRLALFGCYPEIRRIALNMDQVEQYQPPPNPAKITDSRYEGYVERYGPESWELDALEPQVLHDLIASHIEPVIDQDRWAISQDRENEEIEQLQTLADRWSDVAEYISEPTPIYGTLVEPEESKFEARMGWDG